MFTTSMERFGVLEKFKKRQVTKVVEDFWPTVVRFLCSNHISKSVEERMSNVTGFILMNEHAQFSFFLYFLKKPHGNVSRHVFMNLLDSNAAEND